MVVIGLIERTVSTQIMDSPCQWANRQEQNISNQALSELDYLLGSPLMHNVVGFVPLHQIR